MNRTLQKHSLFAMTFALGMSAMGIASAQEQDSPRPTTQTDVPPATDAAMPAPRAFAELDANGDGSIAKDEAAVDPALTQAFGTLDQDVDGKLSPAEYTGYASSRQAPPSR